MAMKSAVLKKDIMKHPNKYKVGKYGFIFINDGSGRVFDVYTKRVIDAGEYKTLLQDILDTNNRIFSTGVKGP